MRARRLGRDAARWQGGQALTEFLLVALALVPLFLLLPMVGKYQDLAHATQMASRYAAFDATSFGNTAGFNPWKPPAQLADEVRRRFYSNTDAPIKTGDVAGDFDANRNVFWRDPWGHALIRNFSDIGVSFGNGQATQAGGFNASGADGTALFANAGIIGLASPGVYTANVSVALANLPAGIKSTEPFDRLDLTIRRHTSLLFDPWHSPDTARTEERVGRLAPVGAVVATVEPVLNAAIEAVDMGHVKSPDFSDLRQWRDVVPLDRLVPEPQ
ncbi:MAG: hypothetical protein H7234_00215 [Herminiimonas sp.]|nr:hypothetical protein [Herminiimonas sp.]